MNVTVGVAGLATLDYVLGRAPVEPAGGGLLINARCGSVAVRPLGRLGAGKLDAVVPAPLLACAEVVRFGGAFHACAALGSILSGCEIRYLDAGFAEAGLAEALGRRGVQVHCLGLHRAPRNVVVQSNGAVILREPIVPPACEPAGVDVQLDWLLRCEAVLALRLKDRPIMTRLASAAAHRRVRLYAPLSPWLPAGYLAEAVMPWASAVLVNLDEAEEVLGVGVGPGLEGAVAAARLLSGFAQFASIFVSLSAVDVVVADMASMSVYRVRLRNAVAGEVRNLIALDPAGGCGCRSAAAAAILAYLECGRSVLATAPERFPAAVAATAAGIAAAARHAGLSRPIALEDFTVSEECNIRPYPFME
jgi:hypothetical protein